MAELPNGESADEPLATIRIYDRGDQWGFVGEWATSDGNAMPASDAQMLGRQVAAFLGGIPYSAVSTADILAELDFEPDLPEEGD